MIQGVHLGGEAEKPRTIVQVDKGIVGIFIALDIGEAAAKLNRLLDVVIALIHSLAFLLGESKRREDAEANCNPEPRPEPAEIPSFVCASHASSL
jgi:hypothetical protein